MVASLLLQAGLVLAEHLEQQPHQAAIVLRAVVEAMARVLHLPMAPPHLLALASSLFRGLHLTAQARQEAQRQQRRPQAVTAAPALELEQLAQETLTFSAVLVLLAGHWHQARLPPLEAVAQVLAGLPVVILAFLVWLPSHPPAAPA